MACCGPNIKYDDSEKLLKKLRNLDKLKVGINLDSSKMEFTGKDGKWRGKIKINNFFS